MPDVVTTEANAGFDGFEDVSSESGKAEKKDSGVQDSGSDVELPDQIVSDAIKRIHVDSEDVDNSDSEKGQFYALKYEWRSIEYLRMSVLLKRELKN